MYVREAMGASSMLRLIRRGCGLGEDVADLGFELEVEISAVETELVLVVLRMLNLQKNGFQMRLQKQNTHKLTVKTTRGVNNSRHERNRVIGTVIIISTVDAYLVSNSFI